MRFTVLLGSIMLLQTAANMLSEREAMWINFHSTFPYALGIHVGGVNALSGELVVDDADTQLRRCNKLSQAKSVQDYVVLPQQPWLDGTPLHQEKSANSLLCRSEEATLSKPSSLAPSLRLAFSSRSCPAAPYPISKGPRAVCGSVIAVKAHVQHNCGKAL